MTIQMKSIKDLPCVVVYLIFKILENFELGVRSGKS